MEGHKGGCRQFCGGREQEQSSCTACSRGSRPRDTPRARATHLTGKEGQAPDISLAASESMSRVAEIAALEVDDVSPGGAQTWLKPTKKMVLLYVNLGGVLLLLPNKVV